ncbi:MAG: hypothetical protein AMJ90_04170 [candidate division Zixibacteria bacterium SM23_73_2]|nr:MAG: hypothetical protein AMJ90_04170 [candidate division Zixibacteria bacterium SM23_73_2]
MRGKTFFFLPLIALMAFLLGCTGSLVWAQGNGAPSGPHYNLNIIGVPKDKTADMTGNHGHRIFVKLEGKTKIWLGEGDDFLVLDANGTDGNGAKFQLPDPDPDDDLILSYSVYARALGRPGGWSNTTTCFVDDNGDTICSVDTLTLVRTKGKSNFTNVSKELLTLYIDTDGDGVADSRVGLFDQEIFQYFWDYDNHGLKLAQLRFYPIEDTIPQAPKYATKDAPDQITLFQNYPNPFNPACYMWQADSTSTKSKLTIWSRPKRCF